MVKQYVLILLMFLSSANASEVRGRIEGGRLFWDTAVTYGDTIMPSKWTVLPSLPPASVWLAHGVGIFQTNLTLNNDGETVTLPLTDIGMLYKSNEMGFRPDASTVAGKCSTEGITELSVMGANCGESSYWLEKTGEAATPFAFSKVILQIPPNTFLNSFKRKAAGEYRGSVIVNYGYDYRFHSSGQRVRHQLSELVSVVIQHNPEELISVAVTGGETFTPRYDASTHGLKGGTRFEVDIQGTFLRGVKLTHQNLGKTFELAPPSNQGPAVPYSVICQQCNDTLLVDVGQARIDEKGTLILGQGDMRIGIEVNVDTTVETMTLEPGLYTDTFSLVFEPAGM